ncbi:MAG: hypothetical protein ACRDMJ_19620, partial [Solirubrobacteraceae bacterium]
MSTNTSKLSAAVAAILAATAIAACGSGSSDASSSSSSSGSGGGLTYAQAQHDAVLFARCMRAHGVNVPDPSSPHEFKQALGDLSGTPAFKGAAAACRHLVPGGGSPRDQSSAPSPEKMAAELAFARCIRGHGFPRFPDPSSAGITHELLVGAGIDLQQPAV